MLSKHVQTIIVRDQGLEISGSVHTFWPLTLPYVNSFWKLLLLTSRLLDGSWAHRGRRRELAAQVYSVLVAAVVADLDKT